MASMEKKFTKIGSLKIGSYVLIDGAVCQIKSYDKSKPGKHGSAKARIVGSDIFSGQKKNLLKPTSADAEVPIIKKGYAQVVAVTGDNMQLMDIVEYNTMDVKIPKEFKGLKGGDEIEYMAYGDSVKIVRKR